MDQSVSSPDKRIVGHIWVNDHGQAMYSVSRDGHIVLDSSSLGVAFSDVDFTSGLHLVDASPLKQVSATYEAVVSKKRHNHYEANASS